MVQIPFAEIFCAAGNFSWHRIKPVMPILPTLSFHETMRQWNQLVKVQHLVVYNL